MELEQLESEYEKRLEQLGHAVVAEFVEMARLGVDLDNDHFHPERPRRRSKSKSAEARAASEGPVDWADRVRRKLGCLKIEMIVEAARLGLDIESIAERTKVPAESVTEVLKIWQPGQSDDDPN